MQEEARAKEEEEEEPCVVCCLDFESHFSLVRPPKWPRLVKNHENLQELPQEVRVLKLVTSIPRIGKEPKSGHGYSFWCVPVWLSLLPAAECQQSKPAEASHQRATESRSVSSGSSTIVTRSRVSGCKSRAGSTPAPRAGGWQPTQASARPSPTTANMAAAAAAISLWPRCRCCHQTPPRFWPERTSTSAPRRTPVTSGRWSGTSGCQCWRRTW